MRTLGVRKNCKFAIFKFFSKGISSSNFHKLNCSRVMIFLALAKGKLFGYPLNLKRSFKAFDCSAAPIITNDILTQVQITIFFCRFTLAYPILPCDRLVKNFLGFPGESVLGRYKRRNIGKYNAERMVLKKVYSYNFFTNIFGVFEPLLYTFCKAPFRLPLREFYNFNSQYFIANVWCFNHCAHKWILI